MTTTKTKILIAGLGSIGRRHARLATERDDVELLLCDPVEQHLADTQEHLLAPPAAQFTDYAEALAAKPDMAILAVPNRLHVPMGIQALEAGCDVLVEKPISDELTEGRKLVATANETGRLLRVGYMLRHDPGLLRLRRMVAEGALGNLVAGRVVLGSYITLLSAVSSDRDKRPNSLIVDYTHEMDYMRWLFGDARSVIAAGALIGELDMKPTPNVFQMIYTMQSGALVQIHLDYVQYPQRRFIEVIGDKQTATFDAETGELRVYKYGKEHVFEMQSVGDVPQRRDDFYRNQLDNFLQDHRSVKATGKVDEANLDIARVTGEDGLAALVMAEAAIQAASDGKAVAIG